MNERAKTVLKYEWWLRSSGLQGKNGKDHLIIFNEYVNTELPESSTLAK